MMTCLTPLTLFPPNPERASDIPYPSERCWPWVLRKVRAYKLAASYPAVYNEKGEQIDGCNTDGLVKGIVDYIAYCRGVANVAQHVPDSVKREFATTYWSQAAVLNTMVLQALAKSRLPIGKAATAYLL